jgi:hypothetical protein
MQCCAQIGINPTGKRLGQAAVQPDPPKKIPNGSEEEAKAKIISAYRSSNASSFNCFGQPNQYDGDCCHIVEAQAPWGMAAEHVESTRILRNARDSHSP